MASPEKTGRGCTTWVLGWLAFVALVCAAPWILCALLTKRLDVGAREQFSREQSCPEDRIQVRARPEVKPSDAFFGTDRREPPSEVARDPARLAIWQKGERERAGAPPADDAGREERRDAEERRGQDRRPREEESEPAEAAPSGVREDDGACRPEADRLRRRERGTGDDIGKAGNKIEPKNKGNNVSGSRPLSRRAEQSLSSYKDSDYAKYHRDQGCRDSPTWARCRFRHPSRLL